MKVHGLLDRFEQVTIKEGAIAFFVIGVMPYAIVNAYAFGASSMTTQEAFLISSIVGCALFFGVNRVTEKHYNFSYEPTIKTFFLLTAQALIAALPAAAIIILMTIQAQVALASVLLGFLIG